MLSIDDTSAKIGLLGDNCVMSFSIRSEKDLSCDLNFYRDLESDL